jgi:hypothetical protein
MNVTLVHPIHGAKVATIEAEVEADEQNGWTRYNPETPSDSEEAAPVNALGTKRKYTRKVVETEAAPEGV